MVTRATMVAGRLVDSVVEKGQLPVAGQLRLAGYRNLSLNVARGAGRHDIGELGLAGIERDIDRIKLNQRVERSSGVVTVSATTSALAPG